MADKLRDYADPAFIRYILAKHPAPRHPETGEPAWESGIQLHGAQVAVINDSYRFQKVDGGVRAGKSYLAALKIYIDMAWRTNETHVLDDLYWVVADSYEMSNEEMRHLDRLLFEGGIPHDFHTPINQSWKISFPHKTTTVETKTASDVTKLASRKCRGVVIAEAAQTIFEAWENAKDRVLETRGWVLMEGTFEKQKGAWYAQLTALWSRPNAEGVRYALPTWDNRVLFPLGRQDPSILAEESNRAPAVFMERYGGEPQKASNVVLPEATDRYHIQHRYRSLGFSFDPELPVFLAIDPGVAHAYAVVAFQAWQNIVWAIDCVYRWNRATTTIIEECATRPWAKKVTEAVIDIAGTQRKSTSTETDVQQWQRLWPKRTGAPLTMHWQVVSLRVGYDLHRWALLNAWPEAEARLMFDPEHKLTMTTNKVGPRLMFSPDAAAPFFGGMVDGRQYAGEYNLHRNRQNREGTIVRDEPIDTDNDGIKAVSYFLVWYFGVQGDRRVRKPVYSAPFEVTMVGG